MQDNPKFTPGPWKVVYRDDESFMGMTLIAPKGLMNPDNVGRLIDEPLETQEKVIAITHHQLMPLAGHEACEKDEEDGNAQLMAAAPEMYEALLRVKGLLNELRDHHGIYGWSGEKAIFDAIVKARGGEAKPLPIKPHGCNDNDLSLVKEIYSRRATCSHESLGIYRCLGCGQLWKIRHQFDDGTGSDDIWLKPGESDRGYEFTVEEAEDMAKIKGCETQ